ncbi:hypothetical protein D3C75_1226100 [compost metagenome]
MIVKCDSEFRNTSASLTNRRLSMKLNGLFLLIGLILSVISKLLQSALQELQQCIVKFLRVGSIESVRAALNHD